MRSSSLAYSASGFGVLRIAACTSFGIRETPVTALIGRRPRGAALNSLHNNPGGAYAATPRTRVTPCHASLVWGLPPCLSARENRVPDGGLAAGAFAALQRGSMEQPRGSATVLLASCASFGHHAWASETSWSDSDGGRDVSKP